MTPVLVIVLFVAGTVAGVMGALLGLGGGVFLVPFLVLVLQPADARSRSASA